MGRGGGVIVNYFALKCRFLSLNVGLMFENMLSFFKRLKNLSIVCTILFIVLKIVCTMPLNGEWGGVIKNILL